MNPCADSEAIFLSIIMPALDEADLIADSLAQFAKSERAEIELIVVDGGSQDRTVEIARRFADQVLIRPGGRAIQMNHGASRARGTYLLFLHADTHLPPDFLEVLRPYFRERCIWGRFDVRLSGKNPLFRLIELMINQRSRFNGIATGDQCIFVRRSVFDSLGGYPEIALMEDIALSRALKKIRLPLCLRAKALTSSRRWERYGIVRTILLMWRLRFLYFLGYDPDKLARRYR